MIVVPGSLLRFKDERLEGQWVECFNAGASAHDMTWTLLNLCINLVGGYKLLASRSPGLPVPAILLWAAACHLVLDGIMVYMHLRHPTVFVRPRDFFVAALRLVRLGLFAVMLHDGALEEQNIPLTALVSSGGGWGLYAAWALLHKMLLVLFIGTGYRARMSQHVWLAGASVAVLLVVANPPRCAAECGLDVAFYAQHYELLAAPLQPLRRLLAFAMWPPQRQRSCFQSCIEAHTFVQVFFGVLAPGLVLAALEEDSRLCYIERHGGSPWHVGAVGLLAYSALLLPLAALVTVEAVGAVAQGTWNVLPLGRWAPS